MILTRAPVTAGDRRSNHRDLFVMSRTAADSLLLLHLVAAIAWIGPALGAWWYVLRSQLWQDQDKRERDALLESAS